MWTAACWSLLCRQEFALAGYEFCISTLEGKIEREKELAEDVLSGRDTWLLDIAVIAIRGFPVLLLCDKGNCGRDSHLFVNLSGYFKVSGEDLE